MGMLSVATWTTLPWTTRRKDFKAQRISSRQLICMSWTNGLVHMVLCTELPNPKPRHPWRSLPRAPGGWKGISASRLSKDVHQVKVGCMRGGTVRTMNNGWVCGQKSLRNHKFSGWMGLQRSLMPWDSRVSVLHVLAVREIQKCLGCSLWYAGSLHGQKGSF